MNLAVLVSGRGSNLQAIIDAFTRGEIDGQIVAVVSDRPDAFALERATVANIPTVVVDFKQIRQSASSIEAARTLFDQQLIKTLHHYHPDWIALAGFMRLLSPAFLSAFPNRVVNIHPSLLPAFPGKDAQRQAFEAGVKESGCTVHYVDEGMDTGPIIAQTRVAILPADTVDSLSDRILAAEHQLYPAVLAQLSWQK